MGRGGRKNCKGELGGGGKESVMPKKRWGGRECFSQAEDWKRDMFWDSLNF